jgi:hypothetical protein
MWRTVPSKIVRATKETEIWHLSAEESEVEARFRDGVKKLGGKAFKWVSPGNPGVPDRIVIIRGEVYFVELKADEGELSKTQKKKIAYMEKLGVGVWVLYGREEVDEFLRRLQSDKGVE